MLAEAFAAIAAKAEAGDSPAAVSQTAASTEPVVETPAAVATPETVPATETPAEAPDPDALFFKDIGRSNASQAAKDAAIAAYKHEKEIRELGWKPEDLRELRELGIPKEEAVAYKQMFETIDDAKRSYALAAEYNQLLGDFQRNPLQLAQNLQQMDPQSFRAFTQVVEDRVMVPENPLFVARFEASSRNLYRNLQSSTDPDIAEAAKILAEKVFKEPTQPDPVIAKREADLDRRQREFEESQKRFHQDADQRFANATKERAGSVISELVTSLVAEKTQGWKPVIAEDAQAAVLNGTVRQILGDQVFIDACERYRLAYGNTAQTQDWIIEQVKAKAAAAARFHTTNVVKRYGPAALDTPKAPAIAAAPPVREPSATNVTSGKVAEPRIDYTKPTAFEQVFDMIARRKTA